MSDLKGTTEVMKELDTESFISAVSARQPVQRAVNVETAPHSRQGNLDTPAGQPTNERATMTMREFIEYTGFGRNTCYHFANSEDGPGTIRIGTKMYFLKHRVDAWLEARAGQKGGK